MRLNDFIDYIITNLYNMNATITERRATLFVANQMLITGENIPVFIASFSKLNLFPSVNKGIGIKVSPKGIEKEDVISLDMKYLDETLKVSIGPDRIDIVSKRINENWDSFRELVMQISSTVVNDLNNVIVRYAQCATIKIKLDQQLAEKSYAKLFKSTEEYPVEWQFRKVIRDMLQSLDGKARVFVNNVYDLSRDNAIVEDRNISNIITLEMDINTLINSDIHQLSQVQELFWVYSAQTIEKAKESYYSMLTNEE